MTQTRLSAGIAGILLVLAGCRGDASRADGAATSDGADLAQETWPADAADCDCRLDPDGRMVMSWDCFCAAYGPSCSSACISNDSYLACGLVVSIQEIAAGPHIRVLDSAGNVVGVQITFDTQLDRCPSDPSIYSTKGVRAGVFPDPSCARQACSCPSGARACLPTGDGGAG